MVLSLLGGGPLHDLAARLRLTGRGGRRVLARVLAAWLLTWVPLLALSAARGEAAGDAVTVPFLEDLTAYARFLFAIPLLLAAGAFVEPRLNHAVRHMEREGLVADEARPALADVLRRAGRLVRSKLELLLLLPVLAAALFERAALVRDASSWERAFGPAGPGALTPAGLWLVAVGLPLYRFLVLRWFWRCTVWAWVQLRLSRLPLHLTPTHPDGACGLAFLGQAQTTLAAPLVLSFGALNAAFVGNRAVHLGIPVTGSRTFVAVFCVAAVTLSLAPLLVFTRRLAQAKRRGLLDYAALGNGVLRAFHETWIAPGAPPARQLLARQDVSSVADLLQTFEAVQRTRLVPLDRPAVVIMVLVILLPLLPLVASQVPREEALQALRTLLL